MRVCVCVYIRVCVCMCVSVCVHMCACRVWVLGHSVTWTALYGSQLQKVKHCLSLSNVIITYYGSHEDRREVSA